MVYNETLKTTPSEDDYKYLAGIYEGEGSLGAYLAGYGTVLRRPQIELRIEMYDLDIMNWIHETFGGHLTPRKRAAQERWNEPDIPVILKGMLPYMRGRRRREQAAQVFKLIEMKKQKLSRKDEHRRALLQQQAAKVNSYNYSGGRTSRDYTMNIPKTTEYEDIVQIASEEVATVNVA